MSRWSLCLALSAVLLHAESASDKSWKNLRQTVKERYYAIALRNETCTIGSIQSVNNSRLVVELASPQNSSDEHSRATVQFRTLDRSDVRVVAEGSEIYEHDVMYSGRSSWSDVLKTDPTRVEHIQVEMKDGSTHRCSKVTGDVEGLVCDGARIRKADVARGFYVRLAPATAWEEYAGHESALLFAPRTWFNFAFFPRLTVLLFDESLPEDNSEVRCKAKK